MIFDAVFRQYWFDEEGNPYSGDESVQVDTQFEEEGEGQASEGGRLFGRRRVGRRGRGAGKPRSPIGRRRRKRRRTRRAGRRRRGRALLQPRRSHIGQGFLFAEYGSGRRTQAPHREARPQARHQDQPPQTARHALPRNRHEAQRQEKRPLGRRGAEALPTQEKDTKNPDRAHLRRIGLDGQLQASF